MNIELPEAYRQKMKALLGDEYDSYLESFSVPACRGFRINPLKTNRDEFFSLTPFTPSPSPFAVDGYYLIDDIGGVGALPAHAAGMFYLQEPSASCAVTILDPKPGMRVLDLCAAPGSKTTQIGALMKNQGLLVANEINGRRAAVLKENVERFGLTNCLILNSDPDVTPVPHDYTLEVYDDQNNQVSYKGKSFETTVYGLLTEISEKKDFSFTLDKEDGKTIIRTVNGVTADYSKDTSRWAFKIDWGESQYNLTEAIGFPEGTYYSITLVYEKDQW